jgi:hypothetical protein
MVAKSQVAPGRIDHQSRCHGRNLILGQRQILTSASGKLVIEGDHLALECLKLASSPREAGEM